DAMGPGRYLVFYLLGGAVAMLAQIAADPHSTIPNLGASGAIAAVMGAFLVTYPRDQIKAVLFIFVFGRITFIPASLLIGFWFLARAYRAGPAPPAETGGVTSRALVAGFMSGAVPARISEQARYELLHPPRD